MSIDTVRLSERAKQQLISLKKRTGIENWNVLCRWALSYSLADESIPPDEKIPSDSSVEMTWKTFAGDFTEQYICIIKQRLILDGRPLSEDQISYSFRLHLHRGISYLTNKVTSLDDLTNLSMELDNSR